MDRSEGGPSQWSAPMTRIPGVDRNAATRQDAFDDGDVADPARSVQRRAAVHSRGGRIEAKTQHQVGRSKPLEEDGERQMTVNLLREGCDQRRFFGDERVRLSFIASLDGMNKANRCRTTRDE